MAISEEYNKKYKTIIDSCRLLRISDYEIERKIHEIELLEGYRPLTIREIGTLTQADFDNVLSVCWHDGKLRCNCIGISSVLVEQRTYGIELSWSDGNGDSQINSRNIDKEIDNIGDGDWNYGLYIKK